MKQRIVTGVIGGAFFVGMIVVGGYPFALLIMLLATIAMIELLKMKKIPPFSINGVISFLLMWTLFIPNHWYDSLNMFLSRYDLFIFFILLLLAFTVISKNQFSFDEVGFVLLTSCYVGLGFHYFIESRLVPEYGMELIFFVLFLIWATDSGAYFIGRSFGKRKLWPEISPKKTIEGSIGGVLAACLIGGLFHALVPVFDSIQAAVLVVIVTSVVGQLGDLVESALKRHYSVKDSGQVLPGHGGVLDRFDSLIFVMPFLYILHLI